MHEMTPSQGTIMEYLESLLSDIPEDETLGTLHEYYENARHLSQEIRRRIDTEDWLTLSVPVIVTKDNTVMKSVTHRVQTVFENDEEELCILVMHDSYVNISKYTKALYSAYQDLMKRYQ